MTEYQFNFGLSIAEVEKIRLALKLTFPATDDEAICLSERLAASLNDQWRARYEGDAKEFQLGSGAAS